jgi:TPR repeat protein
MPRKWSAARQWQRRGGAGSDPAGQYKMGRQAFFDRDYKNALIWYQKAADQGYADAQLEMGRLYQYGLGVNPDPAQAKDWYQRAAQQGNQDAKDLLSRLR